MKDILIRLVWDTVLVVSIGLLLGILIRRWIIDAITTRLRLQREPPGSDLEFQQQTEHHDQKQAAVYAELTELVYRLRNQYREIITTSDAAVSGAPRKGGRLGGHLGRELYLLGENLHRYRALVGDSALYEMFYQFKRELQDAQVLLDRVTRPPEAGDTEKNRAPDESARYREAAPLLKGILVSIDRLYQGITERINQPQASR